MPPAKKNNNNDNGQNKATGTGRYTLGNLVPVVGPPLPRSEKAQDLRRKAEDLRAKREALEEEIETLETEARLNKVRESGGFSSSTPGGIPSITLSKELAEMYVKATPEEKREMERLIIFLQAQQAGGNSPGGMAGNLPMLMMLSRAGGGSSDGDAASTGTLITKFGEMIIQVAEKMGGQNSIAEAVRLLKELGIVGPAQGGGGLEAILEDDAKFKRYQEMGILASPANRGMTPETQIALRRLEIESNRDNMKMRLDHDVRLTELGIEKGRNEILTGLGEKLTMGAINALSEAEVEVEEGVGAGGRAPERKETTTKKEVPRPIDIQDKGGTAKVFNCAQCNTQVTIPFPEKKRDVKCPNCGQDYEWR